MEHKLLVKDSDDELIHEFAKALLKQGIEEGADCYYIDEEYGAAFFKIPKPYKKENENDPDFHHIFIDVEKKGSSPNGKEFSVYGSYHHEHFMKADDAADCVKRLFTGELCEVSLFVGNRKSSLFMINTGDPKQNVDEFMSDFENIYKQMSEGKAGNYHIHMYYPNTFPYTLHIEFNARKELANYNAYAISSILAEHPEYYIFG